MCALLYKACCVWESEQKGYNHVIILHVQVFHLLLETQHLVASSIKFSFCFQTDPYDSDYTDIIIIFTSAYAVVLPNTVDKHLIIRTFTLKWEMSLFFGTWLNT